MMYYDDLDYANKRLSGTVVFTTDKQLVMVDKVSVSSENVMVAKCTDLLMGNNLGWIPLEKIDLTPINLGFYDYGEDMVFFSARRPMRQDWRQGLSSKSYLSFEVGVSKLTARANSLTTVYQPALDKYDSTSKILNIVEKKGSAARAISRDFAIKKSSKDLQLFYRVYPVGELKGSDFKFYSGKEFLKEHFEESVRK